MNMMTEKSPPNPVPTAEYLGALLRHTSVCNTIVQRAIMGVRKRERTSCSSTHTHTTVVTMRVIYTVAE